MRRVEEGIGPLLCLGANDTFNDAASDIFMYPYPALKK